MQDKKSPPPTTVRLPAAILWRLDMLASARGTSRAAVIRAALDAFLERKQAHDAR